MRDALARVLTRDPNRAFSQRDKMMAGNMRLEGGATWCRQCPMSRRGRTVAGFAVSDPWYTADTKAFTWVV